MVSDHELTDSQYVRSRTQPGRREILEFNQALRADPARIRRLKWAKPQLQIPELDLYRLKHLYPELDSPDAEIRLKAWKRFMASSESKPYRVYDKTG